MKRLDHITIEILNDDHADTSYLGEYTDDLEPGVIIRATRTFYEDMTEDEHDAIPFNPRWAEDRGFRPYAGGEPVGTDAYRANGLQDFERMERLNRGDWCYTGIRATAHFRISQGAGCWIEHNISTPGLWGVESDCGKDYLAEIAAEECAQLRSDLIELGFPAGVIDAKVAEALAPYQTKAA